MGNIAVHVENLGKMYHIGGPQERNQTFREAIMRTAFAPYRRAKDILRGQSASNLKEEIWALKDVSFEVNHGEVVGIIGRNGAGKSTLLKILSFITEPTTGYAKLYGRVGALLEVGTGFHQELTGRENIYLNGAILGMSCRDIDRKFDEIVDFAGVEKFIDTPVKHYSSGMGLRLGFAVAAHLEPEILVVDEVLAVGDAEFQKKCLGKMHDVASEGRTVLFVSHNLAAVNNLCSRCLLLQNGELTRQGDVEAVVEEYMSLGVEAGSAQFDLSCHANRRPQSVPILQSIHFLDNGGKSRKTFAVGDAVNIELMVNPQILLAQPYFGIGVDDQFGNRLFSLINQYSETGLQIRSLKGLYKVTCYIPRLSLAPGRYMLSLSVGTIHKPLLDAIDNAVLLDIEAGDYFGSGKLPVAGLGRILVDAAWAAVPVDRSETIVEVPSETTGINR